MVGIGQNEHLFGQDSDGVFLWVLTEKGPSFFPVLCRKYVYLNQNIQAENTQSDLRTTLNLL